MHQAPEHLTEHHQAAAMRDILTHRVQYDQKGARAEKERRGRANPVDKVSGLKADHYCFRAKFFCYQ